MSLCLVCCTESVRRGEKHGYSLWRCPRCNLMFVDPRPDPSRVYNEEYFSGAKKGFGYADYDEDKKPMIPTFNVYLKKIRQHLGGVGRLLDVGAATGFFVELAKKDGFTAEGVEISDYAASAGRALGRSVRTGMLTDIEGTYDCITMCDVIEHVLDPRKELTHAAKLLRSGGVLLVNTPDAGSFIARMLGLKWHHVGPPEHLFYFNRQNIRRLLNETGFDVVEDTTIGKSFTLPYILKTLNRATGASVFGYLAHLSERLPFRLAFPINLYDNMFVMAKKK